MNEMNGNMGKFFERMRWWGGVIIIPLVLALGTWVVKAEVFHQEVELFMEPGPRFTGDGDFSSAQDLRRQIMLDVAAIMDELPPDDYEKLVEERFRSMYVRLNDIQATQQEILKELRLGR